MFSIDTTDFLNCINPEKNISQRNGLTHDRLRDTQQECAKEDVANSLSEAEDMLKAHEDMKVPVSL